MAFAGVAAGLGLLGHFSGLGEGFADFDAIGEIHRVQGNGHRLSKGGFFKRERLRNEIKDALWQHNLFGKAAVAAILAGGDAEDFAFRAEIHIAGLAFIALAAVFGGVEGDAITELPVGHAFTQRDDFTRCLMPHDDGRLAATAAAVHTVDVTAADAAGFYLHEHLACGGHGVGESGVVVKLGGGGEDEGFHGGVRRMKRDGVVARAAWITARWRRG